jgi:mannose-1-phosphate guanylyltransferase
MPVSPRAAGWPTAVVLAGGMGTRLRRLVPDLPKVLVEVEGRPFLAHLLDELRAAGFRDLVLAVGHRAADIRRRIGDGASFGLRVRYVEELELLGTAGAVANAAGAIRTDPFVVLNGDTLVRLDWRGLLDFHADRAAALTVALARVDRRGRYGAVEADSRGRVIAFREKTGRGPGWVNAGVYVIRRAVVDQVPAGEVRSLERELLPAWIGRGLWAYRDSRTCFIDIGTPAALRAARQSRLGLVHP